MKTLVEINPDDFFKIIAYFELDVYIFYHTIQRATWYFRDRSVFGKFETYFPDGKYWPPKNTYKINKLWFDKISEIPESFTVSLSDG